MKNKSKPTLKEAVEKELSRSATSTVDSWFLGMLRSDYENGLWGTNRMDVVGSKYGLK